MSSLAAARADNFYHPPDWDPRKQSRGEHAAGGGAKLSKEDKWKAHPLRERAKRLATEGVLIIRFEMPFNVRCNGCGNHIGKGVRYDAEKRKIGKYFSTSIYSFRMLCHCEDGTSRTCQRRNPHWIEIQTDPKNADYVITEGAARLAEPSADDAEALGVERALDPDETSKRSANPFTGWKRPAVARRRASRGSSGCRSSAMTVGTTTMRRIARSAALIAHSVRRPLWKLLRIRPGEYACHCSLSTRPTYSPRNLRRSRPHDEPPTYVRASASISSRTDRSSEALRKRAP